MKGFNTSVVNIKEHLNVNGLLSEIEELCLTAQKTNAGVIGISKTKLDKSFLKGGG